MTTFLASLRIALRALRVNKMRSALTMIGIIIGVSAVIAMIAVGSGAKAQITEQIASMGSNRPYKECSFFRDRCPYSQRPDRTWERLDTDLRDQGMVAGGNYGPLAGKVFRIGHMGSQANLTLMQQGMEALSQVLGHAPRVIKS